MSPHRRTYNAWYSMRERCTNTKRWDYKYYGGRGIIYTSKWEVFEEFLADMGLCSQGLSLDRIDNDLGYNKDNRRWATSSEQALNRGIKSTNTSGVTGVCYYKK